MQDFFGGTFGGAYVPEILWSSLSDLSNVYQKLSRDVDFQKKLDSIRSHYLGRPTPLTYASSFSKAVGTRVFLKREDLLHTGAHKMNNTIGQVLMTSFLNKKKVIAETGAGQHGVATATAASLLGLECKVFMGEKDMKRQELNVFRMKLLGAEVIPVSSGGKTLKDATNEALRYWASSFRDTHYVIGSVVGPSPFPKIVRDFQSVIGDEVKQQLQDQEGVLPDYLVACVGGGSNAMGLFYPFRDNLTVKLIGVEAGGYGSQVGQHCATLTRGHPGVLHGALTYLLQDDEGQVSDTSSISAGLDYPGVGPEHSFYKDSERATYEIVDDQGALDAVSFLAQTEGVICALETAHAISYVYQNKDRFKKDDVIVINVSGRGDKDMPQIMDLLKDSFHE